MPYDEKLLLSPEGKSTLVIKQQYDANASFANMVAIKGTVIELVLTKPMFWILSSLHFLLWFLKEFHHCRDENDNKVISKDGCISAHKIFHDYPLKLGDIDMLSALVTFFVVFYNGNCYGRYQSMYNNVIAIQGKLHNIGLYLRAYYSQESTRWNVIRYLLASHYIFYWSLKRRYFDWKNSQYKVDPGKFPDFVQNTLVKKGVLIKVEGECIKTYTGNKHKLLYAWSTIAMKRIMQAPLPKGEKGNAMLNTEFEQTAVLTNLKEEIVGMRGAIGTIDNSMLFPIPFQYYHIVNVTLWVNLTLVAYALLFVNKDPNPKEGQPAFFLGTVFTLVAYPLICFVLLGLVEVANAMSDPFGTDACDFNQDAIQEGIYNECKKLCEEPEEPFLSQLGDPSFNPTRNPDGTLMKPGEAPDKNAQAAPEKELTWSQADVQAVLDERDQLKEDFENLGILDLQNQIAELVKTQQEVCERLKDLDNVPKDLQAANYTAVERVGRLEMLLTNQISRLQGELRGDPYELRYVGQQDAGAEASFVQVPQPSMAGGSVFESTQPGQPPLPARRG